MPVVAGLLAAGDVHVELDAVPAVFAADPRVRQADDLNSAGSGRVRPRFDVELLRACRIPAGGLQAVCEEVSRLGGCAQVLGTDDEALLRITPRRAVARGEHQVTKIDREWPVLTAPVRLEDEFREAGTRFAE